MVGIQSASRFPPHLQMIESTSVGNWQSILTAPHYTGALTKPFDLSMIHEKYFQECGLVRSAESDRISFGSIIGDDPRLPSKQIVGKMIETLHANGLAFSS